MRKIKRSTRKNKIRAEYPSFIYKHRSIAGTSPVFKAVLLQTQTDVANRSQHLETWDTIIWVQTWIKLMDIPRSQTDALYWTSSRSSLQSDVNTFQSKQIQTKEGTFPPPPTLILHSSDLTDFLSYTLFFFCFLSLVTVISHWLFKNKLILRSHWPGRTLLDLQCL